MRVAFKAGRAWTPRKEFPPREGCAQRVVGGVGGGGGARREGKGWRHWWVSGGDT